MNSEKSKKTVGSWARRIVKKIIIDGFIIYAALCLLLYWQQRSFIYFPSKSTEGPPSELESLKLKDATISISVMPCTGRKAFIYFGGNAEDVSDRLYYFGNIFRDRTIFLMHYRGFDCSTGKPTQENLFSDAQSLYDKISPKYDDIIIMGRSLGSGIAVHLASVNKVSKVILVTPYDSFVTVAKYHYPYFPIRLLLKDQYESWRYAPLITAPTTIIAAQNDNIIPRDSTISLLNAFKPSVASIIFIPNSEHNSISAHKEYLQALEKCR